MNRKEKIIETALKLFAERGYDSTSTQLIAKEADVSEALIFKHFGNKELLLHHIIKTGYKRIVESNRGMLQEKDSLKFIYKIIDLPLLLVHEEPDFWKLQTRLMTVDIARAQYARFIQPVHALLKKAFTELGYANPEMETGYILMIVEALWKFQIFQADESVGTMLNFIKTKYKRQALAV
jgi:AcrR family transcriptional regulator